MKIISLDNMKLSKDTVNNPPSLALINNITSLVASSFPGATHIATSTPINIDSEFQSHGNSGSPDTLTVKWIDNIHASGLNVLLRGTDCGFEGIYNFPLTKRKGSEWIQRGIDFLNRMKPHLKDGDICGLYPEFDSTLFGKQFQAIDDGTGDAARDANNFLLNFSQAVLDWGIANNIKIHPYITINRSEMINGYIGQPVWQKMGAVVYDFYGFNQTLGEMSPLVDEAFNKYKIPVFQQEWGDTRAANIVASDPTFTSEMAQIFFDKIADGEMLGINFWNLFDTPQEGILTISGDSVTLNAKGKPLSDVFKKNFGTATPPAPIPPQPIPPTPIPPQPNPVPPPPIPPLPTPVFSQTIPVTLTGEIKGSFTFSLNGTGTLSLTS